MTWNALPKDQCRHPLGRGRQGVISWLPAGVLLLAFAPTSHSHLFIFDSQRAGAAPCQPGNGWFVECFYGISDEAAANLLTAEAYVSEESPTFTFRAQYLDWPAGPAAYGLDADFETLGDLLDDYISDLSDLDALDLPFDHFLLRATGYVNARLRDSDFQPAPPVWMDFGLAVFDGGRVRMSTTTITRILFPQPPYGYGTENAIIESPGAYRVEVTLFNRYDPQNEFGAERAGIELLTCHEDGMDTPSGFLLVCDMGDAKIAPPWYFYDAEDVLPVMPSDFDVDNDVDLRDIAGFQACFTGPGNKGALDEGCRTFDDEDNDVDLLDFSIFVGSIGGPEPCAR